MPKTVGYPVKPRALRSRKWIDIVEEARQKLVWGQTFRESTRETIWRRSERQYEGRHWQDAYIDDPTSDLITVNMSFSTVNTIMPYMTGESPNFLVRPYSGSATIRNAKLQQALLNNIWRDPNVEGQEEAETATIDFLIYGDGYMKVGYTLDDFRTDENEVTERADLWVSRISPWDVWIDPTSDGVHNARWVAQRLRVTREELEAGGYANLKEDNVTYGEGAMEWDENTERMYQEMFDGSEYAVVYEFYDLIHRHMIVFSEGEFPLKVNEDFGALPIVQMGNYRLPRSPYHMGELEQLWDLQQELNATRSQMLTHRRRNVQKFVAREGALTNDGVKALESSIVNEVVLVQGDTPLDDIIAPLTVPPLTGDVYNVSDLMMRDIYEISGVNEYLRGATPEIRRTATEATIIEGASNIKAQYKLRQIEKMLRKVGTLILRIAKDVYPLTDYDELQLYLTGRDADQVNRAAMEEQLLGMAGGGAPIDPMAIQDLYAQYGQGNDAVLSPGPDIFEGEYAVEVEQASTELRNPVMREQKYREMFGILLEAFPMLAQAGVPVNIKKVMELWFDAAGVEDPEAIFEVDPMQAMQQQMMGPMGGMGQEPMPGDPNMDGMDPLEMGAFGPENTGAMEPTS